VSAGVGHSQRLHAMVAVQMRTALVTVVRKLEGGQPVVSHTQEGCSRVLTSWCQSLEKSHIETETESERASESDLDEKLS
jgi:hypothetical protein